MHKKMIKINRTVNNVVDFTHVLRIKEIEN